MSALTQPLYDFDHLSHTHTYSTMCTYCCRQIPMNLMESTSAVIINEFAERSSDVHFIHMHPLTHTHTLTNTYAIADVKD